MSIVVWGNCRCYAHSATAMLVTLYLTLAEEIDVFKAVSLPRAASSCHCYPVYCCVMLLGLPAARTFASTKPNLITPDSIIERTDPQPLVRRFSRLFFAPHCRFRFLDKRPSCSTLRQLCADVAAALKAWHISSRGRAPQHATLSLSPGQSWADCTFYSVHTCMLGDPCEAMHAMCLHGFRSASEHQVCVWLGCCSR
jgi:hypothetical protein